MSEEQAHFNMKLGVGLRRRLEREAERRDRSLAYIVREARDEYLPDEDGKSAAI